MGLMQSQAGKLKAKKKAATGVSYDGGL